MTVQNNTFVPQNSYKLSELVECGYGKLFGPNNAKLPVKNMLMLDRISNIDSSGGSHGRGHVVAWSGYPGKGRALGAGEVKFTGEIRPDAKKVTYELSISRIIDRKLVVGIADGTVAVDNQIIYTTKSLKVGLFTPEQSF